MDHSEMAKSAMYARIAKALEGAAIFDSHDRDARTKGWIANWMTFGGSTSVNGKPASTRLGALENLAVELRRQYEMTDEELKAAK